MVSRLNWICQHNHNNDDGSYPPIKDVIKRLVLSEPSLDAKQIRSLLADEGISVSHLLVWTIRSQFLEDLKFLHADGHLVVNKVTRNPATVKSTPKSTTPTVKPTRLATKQGSKKQQIATILAQGIKQVIVAKEVGVSRGLC